MSSALTPTWFRRTLNQSRTGGVSPTRLFLLVAAAALVSALPVGNLAAENRSLTAPHHARGRAPGNLVTPRAAGVKVSAGAAQERPRLVVPVSASPDPKLRPFIVVHREEPLIAARATILKGAGGGRPGGVGGQLAAAAARRVSAALAAQVGRIESEHRRLEAELAVVAGAPGGAVLSGAARRAGGPVFHTRLVANASIVTLNSSERAALAARGFDVREYAQLRTTLVDSVPLVEATRSWNLHDARGTEIRGAGVKIGVIDTGIDYRHPAFGGCTEAQFLAGECRKVAGGFDFVNNTSNPLDDMLHGTHVAATIAGLNTPGPGVAPEATLYALKVCDGSGSCWVSDILRALEWAVDPNGDGDTADHLDLVNLSLGGPGDADDLLSTAVDSATAAGVIVVASAGNNGPEGGTITTPGAARTAITVAASFARTGAEGRVDELASFSSRGPAFDGAGEPILKPDLTAPGVDICAAAAMDVSLDGITPCADGQGIAISGTSMAAPHVAGAAALLRQAHPGWSPAEIKTALLATAIPMRESDGGRLYEPTEVGSGRLDVYAALQLNSPPDELPSVALFPRRALGGTSAPVRGQVRGAGLEEWLLEARLPGGDAWQLVASGVDRVDGGVLGAIDLNGVRAGSIALRLTATFVERTITVESSLKFSSVEAEPIPESVQYGLFAYPAPDDVIEIRGTVGGGGFERYDLTLCHPTASGRLCSTEGLVRANGGTTPITDGVLGYLTPAEIPYTGDVDIIVSLHRRGVPVEEVMIPYFKLPTDGVRRLAGVSNDPDEPAYTTAVAADLGDGLGQRLIALRSDAIECYHLPSQQGCSGFPALANSGGERYLSRLQLRDLDGDGVLEIVVLDQGGERPQVVVVQADGSEMFAAELTGGGGGVSGFPLNPFAFGDLDQDGVEEILYIAHGDRYHVHTFRLSGGEAPGFPVELDQPSLLYLNQRSNPVTVADLDNDSVPEIIVVGLQPKIAEPESAFDYNTRVHLLSAVGEMRPGFPVTLPGNSMDQAALVGHVGPGGAPAIVVTTSDSTQHFIHALSASGESVPGFPSETASTWNDFAWFNLGHFSLADLTGDGTPEIIDATQQLISIYNPSTHEFLPGWERRERGSDYLSPMDQILVANLDDDAEPELLFTSNEFLSGYRPEFGALGVKALNLDGSTVAGFPRVMPLSLGSHLPSVFVRADTGEPTVLFPAFSAIYALALGGCAGDEPLWSHFGGDLSGSNVSTAIRAVPGRSCPDEVQEPPRIILDPNSFEFVSDFGDTRSLLALPLGKGAITTRWQTRLDEQGEWQDLPGADGLPHIRPNPNLGSFYRMVASNAAGSVVSEAARISFSNYPEILSSTPDQSVETGSTVRIEVEARCNKPLTYEWYGPVEPGSPEVALLPDRTGNSFEETFTAPGDHYYYALVSCSGFTEVTPLVLITVRNPVLTPTPSPTPPVRPSPTPTPGVTPTPDREGAPAVAATWLAESRQLQIELTELRQPGCAVSLYLTRPGRGALLRRIRVTNGQFRRNRVILSGRVKRGGTFGLVADQVCGGERSPRSAEVRVRIPGFSSRAAQSRRAIIKAVRRFNIAPPEEIPPFGIVTCSGTGDE